MTRASKSRPAVDADIAPEHDVGAEIAANRRQQRYQELRAQSFPARCHQLLVGVKLCDADLSAALKKEIQKHAAEAAELWATIEASIKQLADAVADAEESDDYMAVLNGLDAVKIDRPVVMQSLVGLWKRAVVLAEEPPCRTAVRVPRPPSKHPRRRGAPVGPKRPAPGDRLARGFLRPPAGA